MRILILRAITFVAMISITLTGFQAAISPTPASAAPENADFTFAVFPVDSSFALVKDSWGARRPGGRRHTGTDIIAPRGTPVLAVSSGVIIEMDYRPSSGYYVRIDHGDGWQSVYLHLNNDTFGTDDGAGGTWSAFYPTLTVGAKVFAGDVIGYVGDSGNAEDTIPHLHVAVTLDGTKVNPYPLVMDALERKERTASTSFKPI